MQPAQPQEWMARSVQRRRQIHWRAVEAQHLVATMRLVDTLAEQELLEQILEASKPALPAGVRALHYLLSTPFRYTSPSASRFRRANTPGIWYGANTTKTACAEVGYWRWRFLMDSEGLRDGELITEHSLFQAVVSGRSIDLSKEPWRQRGDQWMHKTDYAACQDLAVQARQKAVQWIAYLSVRNPGGRCAAVLDAAALALHEPTRRETWVCKVTRSTALFSHAGERYAFSADG